MKTDVLILGTGPAGIQAAIHAARKKAGVIVLGRPEKSAINGAHVENYCCTQDTLNGGEMVNDGIKQAIKFGAEFINEDAVEAVTSKGGFVVKLESGRLISSKTLIMAIGIKRNSAGVMGENEYLGRGVSYCVECDANFYKNKKVAVLGDGSAAAAGAALLKKYAMEVTLISRKLKVTPELKAEVISSGVKLMEGSWIREISGDGKKVDHIVFTSGSIMDVDGVFIELGAKGAMELAAGLGVFLDQEQLKYIETDKKQATNIPGIYAAGDICGAPFQMAKAVGEGCTAGINAADYSKQRLIPEAVPA
jgi:thioredoxin reductase (NADPH)